MKAILSRQPQFAGFLRLFQRVLRVTADHPLRVGRNPSREAPVLPQLYGGRPLGPCGKRREERGREPPQRPRRIQSRNSAHEPDARQPASAPAWRARTSQGGSHAHQRASPYSSAASIISSAITARATSGAGTPASDELVLDAARTALSATAGAGLDVAAGCGAGLLPAAGVVPGGTPVVAVGPGEDDAGGGVAAAVLVAAALAHAPAARRAIASSSACGKSGAYWSMSLGTCCLAPDSCLADHAQGSTRPL